MVQTYEGALTETDAILQRMKTLADQAANGTYQDDVDRDAIQLEFDQLNDELNQIADTDFNGVVVLNGGEMSDGTKAVDGKFDYAGRTRDAKQLTKADINLVDDQNFNNSGTLKTIADDVWKEISNNAWDRSAVTNEQGPDSVDVTLSYDKTANTWTVESATNGADKAKLEADPTDNGGFVLQTAGGTKIANVVVDLTSLKNGDTITLTLNNPVNGISAPTNAGAVQTGTTNFKENGDTKTAKDYDVDVKIETYAQNDDNMTSTIKTILDAVDGAKLDVTYTKDKALADAATNLDIKWGDGTTTTGIKGDGSAGIVTAGTVITLKDGTQFMAKLNAGKIEVYDDAAGTNKLVTITPGAHAATEHTSGTISYDLGIEYKNYDASKIPSVEVKEPENAAVSKSDAFGQATAPLTYTDHIILQSGARTKDAVDFTFKYSSGGMGDLKANMNCSAREDGLGTANLKLTDQKSANYAIDRIDNAINKVSMVRATFGAVQNRLEHKIDNMNVTKENMTSAESRIRDTNMAEEMTNFTKNQILSQASQAMLAQANQLPQGVLQLLG